MRILAAALVLAACGGHDPAKIDGGDDGDGPSAVDAEIDADPNIRGPVTVHVVDKLGGPLASVHVVFIDTDQTVTELLTDATGTAQASVYPNASVTAIREHDTTSPAAYTLATVMALKPGDDIKLLSDANGASVAEDSFSQRQVLLPSTDLATATKSGSTGTFTTFAPHGLAAGDSIVIAGALPSGYNGTWTVATASGSSFTANLGSGGLSNATTPGTVTKATLFTVTYSAYTGAANYTLYTPCGTFDVGAVTSPQLTLRSGCIGSAMDIAVIARNSSNAALAYAQQAAIAVSSGGSATITDTWHALDAINATYSNPTTRVTSIGLERFVPYVRGVAAATSTTTTSGANAVISISAPLAPTAFMKTRLRCPNGTSPDCVSSAIGTATQTVTQQVDGTLATYALDIGANLLPWVSAVYQPTTQTLEVTQTGTGAVDLVEQDLRYTRGQVIYTLRVFMPAAATLTFPTLPADVPGDPTVRATDPQSTYHVYLCETPAVGGYRNAIKNPFETLGICEMSSTVSTKPLSSLLSRLSQWDG